MLWCHQCVYARCDFGEDQSPNRISLITNFAQSSIHLHVMDKAYIRSIYRRLWRAAHYAVQNRNPSKYIVRAKLRHAFRTETQLPSAVELDNTEQFLRTAGRRRGLENNIVKSLCTIHWYRARGKRFVLDEGGVLTWGLGRGVSSLRVRIIFMGVLNSVWTC